MTGDGGTRKQRLLDMLDTVAEKPRISSRSLGEAAQRKFLITNRTAQDYIDTIVAAKWAVNVNGLLEITKTGRKALLNSEDPEANPESDPAPQGDFPLEATPASPSPPPTVADAK